MDDQPATAFVSYRREDSQGTAGRIADFLRRETSLHVLIDVESIGLGRDYTVEIVEQIRAADIVLVVIGPTWLSAAGPDGAQRLLDEEDAVRLEIATAITEAKPLIPLLVDGATMPARRELPEAIDSLAVRNGAELRHQSFARDLADLAGQINQLLELPAQLPAVVTKPTAREVAAKRIEEDIAPNLKAKARATKLGLAKKLQEDSEQNKDRAWLRNPKTRGFLNRVLAVDDEPTELEVPARFPNQESLETFADPLTDEEFLQLVAVLRSRGWTNAELESRVQGLRPRLDLGSR